jgi:hypothetical protein
MHHPARIRKAVLLWVAVTALLWATFPLAPFFTNFTWFGWMPHDPAPVHQPLGSTLPPSPPHSGPGHMFQEMAILLIISSVLMAVVLWFEALYQRRRA